ncbi:MAG TPA: hypothetical protein PKH39_19215, partial [Woeseiaceae bacterium]|nr:hypothetical protein [Woeseiaceae bacterium]
DAAATRLTVSARTASESENLVTEYSGALRLKALDSSRISAPTIHLGGQGTKLLWCHRSDYVNALFCLKSRNRDGRVEADFAIDRSDILVYAFSDGVTYLRHQPYESVRQLKLTYRQSSRP